MKYKKQFTIPFLCVELNLGSEKNILYCYQRLNL